MGYSSGVGPNTKKLQAVSTVENASTAAWSAVSSQRWTLDTMYVSYSGATAAGVHGIQEVLLREVDDSASITFLKIPIEASQKADWYHVGYSSSATNSSLRLTAPASATVSTLFVGHSGGE